MASTKSPLTHRKDPQQVVCEDYFTSDLHDVEACHECKRLKREQEEAHVWPRMAGPGTRY